MWEIYEEKLGTGEVVAKYINARGLEAFKVMESGEAYFTMPNYKFIYRHTVSRQEVLSLCETDEQRKDEKFILTLACGLLGRNYRNQPGVKENKFI